MRVIVFGATGNVGTSVLQRLADRDAVTEIVGVARRRPDRRFRRTRFTVADVARDDLVPVLRGADAAVHLAWRLQPLRRPESLERTNVEGSRRVFEAVARAGVPALVYASSVGAYAPGRGAGPVDESHPTTGVETSLYSRQKARVEGLLDRFEREEPAVRVVRIRPALVFKREASWGIRRLFLGPFAPAFLLRPGLLRLIPGCGRLQAQGVHSLDVGEAFARAVLRDVRGAFNIAAPPVLDADLVARRLNARSVGLPCGVLRAAVAAAYRLRVAPIDEGWVDLALGAPVMQTDRARKRLGWRPRIGADEALVDLLDGIASGTSFPTPPLRPQWRRAVADLLGSEERWQDPVPG